MPCPNCWRTVDSTGTPQQLGDYITLLTYTLGGRQLKKWFKQLFNRDCGCNKRREQLNRRSHALLSWLKRSSLK